MGPLLGLGTIDQDEPAHDSTRAAQDREVNDGYRPGPGRQVLLACDGPDAWKQAAGVDQLANRIETLRDMHGVQLMTSTALTFLWGRYDRSNFTAPCKFR